MEFKVVITQREFDLLKANGYLGGELYLWHSQYVGDTASWLTYAPNVPHWKCVGQQPEELMASQVGVGKSIRVARRRGTDRTTPAYRKWRNQMIDQHQGVYFSSIDGYSEAYTIVDPIPLNEYYQEAHNEPL